jgi:phosphoribosylaminoimidazole-succinocarboxamide synthase
MSPNSLVHQGSTKDVYKSGPYYLFKFSDRYSVFDWGEMPDHLAGKGASLARFTTAIYKKLENEGIAHHLINQTCAANEIIVKPFEVVRDSRPLTTMENVFIPLEIIFRLGFAKGSSLAKRIKTIDGWKELGFSRPYVELEMFEKPMIEFTTKLERFDRPLTHSEARILSGMNDYEWNSLLNMTTKIAETLKSIFDQHEITLWDGKVEMALGEYKNGNREIILVDSIGPDELRLTKNSVQLSKEIIREFYRQTEWYTKLTDVKERHKAQFKEFISPPPELPKTFKTLVEELYQVLAEIIEKPMESNQRLQRLMMNLKGAV